MIGEIPPGEGNGPSEDDPEMVEAVMDDVDEAMDEIEDEIGDEEQMSIDQIDSQGQEEQTGWSFDAPMSHQSHEIIGEEQEDAMAPSLEQIEGKIQIEE